MGLGYEFPQKKTTNDRSESYGAWVTKYNNAQKQSFSWKSSNDDKNSKEKKNNGPWGPVFKDKKNFVDMHFC